MLDLKDINIEFINKLLSNATPLISSIVFVYLFLTIKSTYLLWFSIVSLFELALYMNFNERVIPLLLNSIRKNQSKNKQIFQIFALLGKDILNLILLSISFILTICAFIFLIILPKDMVSWILLFVCVLYLFHFLTIFGISAYLWIKYPEYVNKDYVLKSAELITKKLRKNIKPKKLYK